MFDFNNFETVLTGKFRNFAAQITSPLNDDGLEKVFNQDRDQVAGHLGWKLTLQKESDSGGTFIVPSLSWPKTYFYSKLNVRILMNPLNHFNPENEKFKYADRFYFDMDSSIEGKKMYLSEILNGKNGWLKNGVFTVKIGFYAESLLDKQGVWRFNLLNNPFGMKSKSHVVYLYQGDTDYRVMCHIQLLKLHCKELYRKLNAKNEMREIRCFNDMKICLDILHGCQLKYEEPAYRIVLKTAKLLEFSNVLRYIELQFIEDPQGEVDIRDRILFAIQWNFNRLLIRLLKDVEDLSVLKELFVIGGPTESLSRLLKKVVDPIVLKEFWQTNRDEPAYVSRKKVDIEKMSGESMKIFVKKLLYDSE